MEPFTQGHLQRPIRVLLCPDQPDWAFDNIANNIVRHSQGAAQFQKLYLADNIDTPHLLFERIFAEQIDVCHIFWREDLFHLLSGETLVRVAETMMLRPSELVSALGSCVFTTSVYDHLHSSPSAFDERRDGYCLIDGYTVSSNRLQDIYRNSPLIPPPDAVIIDGVDICHFHPGEGNGRRREKPTVGWVGNSSWGKSAGPDIKGFRRLFTPMLAELERRGKSIGVRIADPQVKRIPFEEMPGFYRDLDVLVCTSQMEGTPNPVLEAMASGVPVISTDVGIVRDVSGPLQSAFIVDHEDPVLMADKLAELLFSEGLGEAIGRENRAQAEKIPWEITVMPWLPFWMNALQKSRDRRFAARREAALLAQCHAELWSRP